MNRPISTKKPISLGSDPEMFVFQGAKLLPAYEFLQAKDAGQPIFWDGFQAEWRYDHEDKCSQDSLINLTRERLAVLNLIAKDRKAKLSLTNVVRVPQVTLETAHTEHVELGCMPSYNAYQLRGQPVENPRKLPYRFAGGHMHFGTWTRRPKYERIVCTLDDILGVWAVGAARYFDNPVRRMYYGLAGEYRKPEYKEGFGVEYRVLSNFWLASPNLMRLVWNLGTLCVRLAQRRNLLLWAGNTQETIDTINNCDAERAEQILTRNEPMLRWILGQVYKQEEVDQAIKIGLQGYPNEGNFLKEWGI